jgi:hypothetical protein
VYAWQLTVVDLTAVDTHQDMTTAQGAIQCSDASSAGAAGSGRDASFGGHDALSSEIWILRIGIHLNKIVIFREGGDYSLECDCFIDAIRLTQSAVSLKAVQYSLI